VPYEIIDRNELQNFLLYGNQIENFCLQVSRANCKSITIKDIMATDIEYTLSTVAIHFRLYGPISSEITMLIRFTTEHI
jgi:hypothetical protein